MVNITANNSNRKSSGGKSLGNKNDAEYCNYDDFKYVIRPIYNSCNEINQTEVAVAAAAGAGTDHGYSFRIHPFASTSASASNSYDESGGNWKNKRFLECHSMQSTKNWEDHDNKLHSFEDFPNMKLFSNMKIYSELFRKKCLNFYNMISSSSSNSSNSNSSKAKVLKKIDRVDVVPIKKRNYSINKRRTSLIPSLGSTSFITILAFICLETILLSTMSTCAKTFYMHWNTSNSIFRIDNTDHIIDVNKGNLAFEFDQVHIICPVYEPGTYENETEKYIIYNVSKVEYETCRITNADPRVIAICDKPHKLMFFTITFRPFTPQPGGLEFLPGNDYYFISTSSKDDLYRRIGGRCSTNNMKVVFKVCCSAEEKNKTISATTKTTINNSGIESSKTNQLGLNIDGNTMVNNNNGNPINTGLSPNGFLNSNADTNNVNIKPINGIKDGSSLDQFNRIPIQTVGVNSGVGFGNHGGNGIMLTPGHGSINMIPNGGLSSTGIGQYPGFHSPGGIRINNMPPQQNYPSHKSTNDDHYEKHPNEVVKNEELTYNSGTSSLHSVYWCRIGSTTNQFVTFLITKSLSIILMLSKYSQYLKLFLILELCPYRLMFLFALLLIFLLRMWRHHHNFRSKWKYLYFRNGFSDTLSEPSIKYYRNKTELTEAR